MAVTAGERQPWFIGDSNDDVRCRASLRVASRAGQQTLRVRNSDENVLACPRDSRQAVAAGGFFGGHRSIAIADEAFDRFESMEAIFRKDTSQNKMRAGFLRNKLHLQPATFGNARDG